MVVNPSNRLMMSVTVTHSKQNHMYSYEEKRDSLHEDGVIYDQHEFELPNTEDKLKRVLITGNWWSVT